MGMVTRGDENVETQVANEQVVHLDTGTQTTTQTTDKSANVYDGVGPLSSNLITTNSFFFIPFHHEPKEEETYDHIPKITLGTFAESAWLEYGHDHMNQVGKSRSLPFDLFVPEDVDSKLLSMSGSGSGHRHGNDGFGLRVQVERVPIKKGFSLGLVCDEESDKHDGGTSTSARTNTSKHTSSSTYFMIKKGETKRLFLTWTPVEPGGVCEVLYLKLKRGRVRVTARGHARGIVEGKQTRTSVSAGSADRSYNAKTKKGARKVSCPAGDIESFFL